MKDVASPATATPCGAPGVLVTPKETSSPSAEQLQTLFISNYRRLTDAAYAAYPGLLVFDAERIMAALGDNLARYKGSPESGPFLKWATAFVKKEAQRYQTTEMILRDYRLVIYAAIRENLWTSARDRSVTTDDIFNEIAYLVFQKASGLARAGTAKLPTRLYALVKRHCWFYHNSYNVRHRERVKKNIEKGVPLRAEHLSEEELASMNPAPVYDAGYAECGLLES